MKGRPKWKRDRCKPLGGLGLGKKRWAGLSSKELDSLEALIDERLRRKKKPAQETAVSE